MHNFDDYLQHCLDDVKTSNVKAAMNYSLLAGGKRIRPQLLFAALQAYGIDEQIAYPIASAIEMIHTYSLIHDDLPAMDNDTLRRGKPTCHVQYGEACAILAGDALLTQAFLQVCKVETSAQAKVKLVQYLADYSGANGMVLGQIKDIEEEVKADVSVEDLKEVHYYKTGKLLTLPLICAAILADDEENIETWRKIGHYIGLSFQIQDDILDVTATKEELGKNINSDAENNKNTYVSLLGIEDAKQAASKYYEKAWDLLCTLDVNYDKMNVVFDALTRRRY